MRATVFPCGSGQYDGQGVYCGLSAASEVSLIFTTLLHQFVSVFLFALFSDEPEVSSLNTPTWQVFNAAHVRWIVKLKHSF